MTGSKYSPRCTQSSLFGLQNRLPDANVQPRIPVIVVFLIADIGKYLGRNRWANGVKLYALRERVV